MPEKEHRQLAKSARKAGLSGEEFNAYVYGTLEKIKKARARKHNRSK